MVRIGLTTDARKVTVTGDGPFRIIDPSTGKPVWKDDYNGEILVTTHGAHPTGARVWRAQVAAPASREEADALAAKLRAETGEQTTIAYSPDRGSWRLRLGGASTRDALAPALQKLREMGYTDAWAVDEPAAGGPAWLQLVDSDYATVALTITRVRIEPVGASSLVLDGKRYRGTLEALVDAAAGLRVVNVLPLETYLRGVVPAELGPAIWPEPEALKAQSVAARTYALRNLGRFAEEGYDLCDSPRCQVYDGASGEHPLSDRAIRDTAGTIATYNGQPINALFTSTCGGHTEDGGEIFPEEAVPYLRGVPCYADQESLGREGIVLEGSAAAEAGGPAEEVRAAAALGAVGIVDSEAFSESWRRHAIGEVEARALIERTGQRLGAQGRIGETRAAASRLGFPLALGDRMGWRDQAGVLVEAADLPALLPFSDLPASLGEDARILAVLAGRGLLPAAPGGALRPGKTLDRGEALLILERAAGIFDLPDSVEGAVIRGNGRTIRLRRSENELALASPKLLALFLDLGPGPVAHRRLTLYPGDRIRALLAQSGEVRAIVVLPGRKGLSDDRYSPTWSWETSLSSGELGQKLSAKFDVGELRDLVPQRRGVSGRVVALRVVGDKGEALLTGFNIRTALGLKETLFAIDRQRWPDGKLRRVVFSGKGWGHGVGMCQMGAYGMAVRGASYSDILRHYYTGIELTRAY